MKHRNAIRVVLGALAVSAVVPGVWATLAPHSFYTDFPGAAHWVDRLPPDNEHLVTDAGGFYLAFAVLFTWAAVSLRRALVVPACVAWSVFSAVHLAYHATHLAPFPTADAVGEIAALAVVLALPIGVLMLLRQESAAACGTEQVFVRGRA
jgi:hypothetical protein